MKKRTYIPPPIIEGLDPKLSHLAQEAQLEQFLAEVKNYNNHDRLMTSRMDNVLVYKIPDDVCIKEKQVFTNLVLMSLKDIYSILFHRLSCAANRLQ